MLYCLRLESSYLELMGVAVAEEELAAAFSLLLLSMLRASRTLRGVVVEDEADETEDTDEAVEPPGGCGGAEFGALTALEPGKISKETLVNQLWKYGS